jgi:hypothetical protein
MFVRITRTVTLTLWNHDPERGDSSVDRTFRRGEIYLVGEVSEVQGGLAIVEFINLGYAEVADDVWVCDESIRLWFSYPDDPCVN